MCTVWYNSVTLKAWVTKPAGYWLPGNNLIFHGIYSKYRAVDIKIEISTMWPGFRRWHFQMPCLRGNVFTLNERSIRCQYSINHPYMGQGAFQKHLWAFTSKSLVLLSFDSKNQVTRQTPLCDLTHIIIRNTQKICTKCMQCWLRLQLGLNYTILYTWW